MTRSGKAIISAAALVFLVGACGSSSSKGSGGGAGLQNTPGGSTAHGGSSGGSSSGNSSGNSSLDSLVAKGKTADIKITYASTGSGDNTSFTLVQRGKDSVEKFGDSAIYNVGGKATTCEGTGASATCTSVPANADSGGLAGSLVTTYDQLLQNKALSPYLSSLKSTNQTIAGRSAKCLTLTGAAAAAAGGSGTVCIDSNNGVILKAEGSSGGTVSGIVATSVGTPSDSDFALPATPKSAP
ncbi:MAG TPA: hypothetical protein VGI86_09995 [Acidimicrobiia bacterium]|jgi:hypothetical protein